MYLFETNYSLWFIDVTVVLVPTVIDFVFKA